MMEPLTICELQYDKECNIYGKYFATSFTETTILINSDLIESVKLLETTFWYLDVREETSGWLWKTTNRICENKESHKEIFYQLTMSSGEKFLTQNNGFSELTSLN